MSISEDLLHVNAVLETMAEGLSGEKHAVLHMISANIHALAEQVEALEGVPLETREPLGLRSAHVSRLAPVASGVPQ